LDEVWLPASLDRLPVEPAPEEALDPEPSELPEEPVAPELLPPVVSPAPADVLLVPVLRLLPLLLEPDIPLLLLLVEPVAPVPALALGEVPAVSSIESRSVPPWRWLLLRSDEFWPHFISDEPPLLDWLELFRRDQRKAPAAATAVAAAAAATGRDLALSTMPLIRLERWFPRAVSIP
jgi:hypothetical protein